MYKTYNNFSPDFTTKITGFEALASSHFLLQATFPIQLCLSQQLWIIQ